MSGAGARDMIVVSDGPGEPSKVDNVEVDEL